MNEDNQRIKYRVDRKAYRLILRNPNISRGAKALLENLLSYAGVYNRSFPDQETLAKDFGVCTKTIRNDLNELKSFGVLEWKKRGFNKSNLYQFPKEFYRIVTKDWKDVSLDSGTLIPSQSGNTVPPKVVIENSHIKSSHIFDHIKNIFPNQNLNKQDIEEIEHLILTCGNQLVLEAINLIKKRNNQFIKPKLVYLIIKDWVDGIQKLPKIPRPVCNICQQTGFFKNEKETTAKRCECEDIRIADLQKRSELLKSLKNNRF